MGSDRDVVYVCRDCPFNTNDEAKALAHADEWHYKKDQNESGFKHRVVRFETGVVRRG